MASKTMPAIREIVVKLIDYVSSQWSMGQSGVAVFVLPTACCLLPTVSCSWLVRQS